VGGGVACVCERERVCVCVLVLGLRDGGDLELEKDMDHQWRSGPFREYLGGHSN
jgi:hypothetical protein